jgi:hypothetical protein
MIASDFAYLSHRQEAYSGAFIRAVCASAGCAVAIPETDDDKIDYTLGAKLVGTVFAKPKIDVQAKCRLGALGDGASLSYALDLDTYDNLRNVDVIVPRILVVVIVPDQVQDWLIQTEAQMGMRHCAYWCSLKGMAASTNATSQSVSIPRTNIFSPTTLAEMMQRVANGEDI